MGEVAVLGVAAALLAAAYLSLLALARLHLYRARCADCPFHQEASNQEVVRTAAMLRNLRTMHRVLIEGRQ